MEDDVFRWLKVHALHRLGTKFLSLIWYIWKARNVAVFEHSNMPKHVITTLALEYCKYTRKTLHVNDSAPSLRVRHLVRWLPPPVGRLKLNSDGSVRASGYAAAGGLIRDSLGHWKHGYSVNIGITSSLEAELWGLVYGLQVALSLDISDLLVDLDSAVLVSFFAESPTRGRAFSNLMLRCLHLVSLFTSITFRHTFREGNQAADYLANLGHGIAPGLLLHQSPPKGLGPILLRDEMGIVFPRL